jgi:hypothetical protein
MKTRYVLWGILTDPWLFSHSISLLSHSKWRKFYPAIKMLQTQKRVDGFGYNFSCIFFNMSNIVSENFMGNGPIYLELFSLQLVKVRESVHSGKFEGATE